MGESEYVEGRIGEKRRCRIKKRLIHKVGQNQIERFEQTQMTVSMEGIETLLDLCCSGMYGKRLEMTWLMKGPPGAYGIWRGK